MSPLAEAAERAAGDVGLFGIHRDELDGRTTDEVIEAARQSSWPCVIPARRRGGRARPASAAQCPSSREDTYQ